MPKKKTIEELQAEQERIENELKLKTQRLKALKQQTQEQIRKERTHRLCTHGAMLEQYLPPEEYTDEQIDKFLMKQEIGGWLAEPMLSLGGVYEPSRAPEKMRLPIALQDMLEHHPEVTTIDLHLDNDKAGKTAAWAVEWQLKDRYNISYEPPPQGKDLNEYLGLLMRKRLTEKESYHII